MEEVARLCDAWSQGVPVHRIHGGWRVGNLLEGGEEVAAELRRQDSEEPESTNKDLFWEF